MNKNIYFKSLILLVVASTNEVYSQSYSSESFRSSLRNEMKKELMKQVNPTIAVPNPTMKQAPYKLKNDKRSDDMLYLYKKYKSGSGGEEFDDHYQVDPRAITYSSDVPINQIEPGKVIPVYTGGHFKFVNPATNGLGLVRPSGINLSGGGKKKMSAKTRRILEVVFGVNVEDKNELE